MKLNNQSGSLYILFFLLLLGGNSFGQNIVKDTSFEDGVPNAYWIEHSTNFSHVICDNSCGSISSVKPRSGTHFAWLGGSSAQNEYGSVKQNVLIPSSNYAQLSFYLKTPLVAPNMIDYFQVTIDSVVIFDINAADSATYKYEYIQVLLDISAYATNSYHQIKFKCFQSGTNGVTHYIIDDVNIFTSTNIDSPTQNLNISVFPQPSNNFTLINFSQTTTCELNLVSFNGQVVYKSWYKNQIQIKINTSELSSGIYFLIVKTDLGIVRKKLIISR